MLDWLAGDLDDVMAAARALRDSGYGKVQTFSPKVFIPLTQLCRNHCHYCTFSRQPDRLSQAYLKPDQVLAIAHAGRNAGCTEALFTIGEKPEARFELARLELDKLGHASTLSYLAEMARLVFEQTGLLPHINAGTMTRDELKLMRGVSASQGLMLESLSERLCLPGGVHFGSPDKMPAARMATLRMAGELAIPYTSGILIGIGETRRERIQSLLALRDLHREFGHIQEVIVQNFRAKDHTPMAGHAEPDMDDLLWSIAAARLIMGPDMNIQAPPNLSSEDFARLQDADINDWGGISPVTPDHVNPEAAWPDIAALDQATLSRGRILVRRLPVYPAFVNAPGRWQVPKMAQGIARLSDMSGFAREDQWAPGMSLAPTVTPRRAARPDTQIAKILAMSAKGQTLTEDQIVALFNARGDDVEQICQAADQVRRTVNGDVVTYVVNRNINYTNICSYKCGFCAFSKGTAHKALRGTPYNLDHAEIVRRAIEAHDRGATEVCLQGGIHPDYTGQTYIEICKSIRTALPQMHIHAFSPLEILQGSATLGISVEELLVELRRAGLCTLPGTAAEILDDEIRAIICPDKLTSSEWLSVIETAHRIGFRTTATIMFGHVEGSQHLARHLLKIRQLQERTGGFSEFVPLPFVHMEAPMSLKGTTRSGPTFREVRLMHAISRLVLHPVIPNIQASWVKLGPAGLGFVLDGGVNDLGGTLMNESISRAAGTQHGQEFSPRAMENLILSVGRTPRQRTTLYETVDPAQRLISLNARALTLPIQTPPKKSPRGVLKANERIKVTYAF